MEVERSLSSRLTSNAVRPQMEREASFPVASTGRPNRLANITLGRVGDTNDDVFGGLVFQVILTSLRPFPTVTRYCVPEAVAPAASIDVGWP